jgi:hypothetical protein
MEVQHQAALVLVGLDIIMSLILVLDGGHGAQEGARHQLAQAGAAVTTTQAQLEEIMDIGQ